MMGNPSEQGRGKLGTLKLGWKMLHPIQILTTGFIISTGTDRKDVGKDKSHDISFCSRGHSI